MTTYPWLIAITIAGNPPFLRLIWAEDYEAACLKANEHFPGAEFSSCVIE